MLKTILKNVFLMITFFSVTLSAQTAADTVDVTWDGSLQPGQLEAAIIAGGGEGVYRLTDGAKYLTSEHIPVTDGKVLHIVGSMTDGKPAEIQPLASAEGLLGHTDGQMFNLVGANAELGLKGLILNAYAAGGQGLSLGIAAARSTNNKIVIDDCIVTHVNYLAFHTMGKMTDFHITNSMFRDFTNGPGGMFYGGVVWGAGSWMGTIDTLVVRNNTIDGVIGEAMVIYEHVDYGIVDHNTFTNIVMDIIWYGGQNNLQVTNNLLYNTKSYGQSTYDVSNWNVWWASGGTGVGQMAIKPASGSGILSITPAVVTLDTNLVVGSDGFCDVTETIVTPADTVFDLTGNTYTMSDGQLVNNSNRNINWHNNAAVWSPALIGWMENMTANPWTWETSTVTPAVYTFTEGSIDTVLNDDCSLTITVVENSDSVLVSEATTTVTGSQSDAMMPWDEQLVWADSLTLSTIASGVGVTSVMNAVLTAADLGMSLDENYITHQLARTLDFRDDQTTQGVGIDNNWMYQHDDDMVNVEWPMHYDASYSATSIAATHSTTGGPIGSNRWMDFELGQLATDNSVVLPKAFALKQNYPNPFNPSTEIAFSLEQASTINLTIFNVLGQRVKVLAEGSKQAGTHTLSWDGLDEMGSSVSTGLYFYTLTDGINSVTKKMALMK